MLDVSLDPVLGRPFAALRSMFVMETNADVARIAWREPGGKAWRECKGRFGLIWLILANRFGRIGAPRAGLLPIAERSFKSANM